MPEEPEAEDPALADLGRTLALLKPIRRQRLSRAERDLRQEQEQLAALAERLDQGRNAFQHQQRENRQRRADLLDEHRAEAKPLAKVQDWIASEHAMIGALANRQERLNELAQDHGRQEQRIDTARQTVIQSQRAVEKLDYLSKHLGGTL
jgi:uncharacterized coiled-coil protein SlyX